MERLGYARPDGRSGFGLASSTDTDGANTLGRPFASVEPARIDISRPGVLLHEFPDRPGALALAQAPRDDPDDDEADDHEERE